LLLLGKPIIVYGHSYRQGSSNALRVLCAYYLTFAENLGAGPTVVIYRRELKPKV
jgi:hypothetical protein